MLVQLFSIFLEVVAPVFALAGLGYFVGPRLLIDARSLSRLCFYLFIPAYVFDVMSRSRVPLGSALTLTGYITVAQLMFGAIAWALARLLRRSREMTAAYVMVSIFGNTGNFGLALIQFRLGDEALIPATLYFVASLVVSFGACIAVAAGTRGGGLSAVTSVLKTPALLAALPALAISALELPVPVAISRSAGLLASAMIPSMLFLLGLQLAHTRQVRISSDVWLMTALRLIGAPAIAALWAVPFGLTGVERAAGILQSAMPAAVLVSVVAVEYEIEPSFVTTTIFFSTVCSLPTLTVLLSLV